MQEKGKKVLVILITIFTFAIILFAGTYAYFNSTGTLANVIVSANVAENNSSLIAVGGVIELNVEAADMQQSMAGNLVATGNGNLTVSYLSGINEVMTCGYDLYYKWESDSDEYALSKENELEFTYAVAETDFNVAETNFVDSTGAEPQKLNENRLGITNSSETTPTVRTYQITANFYNINADQMANANKSWKVKFYVDNVMCAGGSNIPPAVMTISASEIQTASGKTLQQELDAISDILN